MKWPRGGLKDAFPCVTEISQGELGVGVERRSDFGELLAGGASLAKSCYTKAGFNQIRANFARSRPRSFRIVRARSTFSQAHMWPRFVGIGSTPGSRSNGRATSDTRRSCQVCLG